VGAEISAIWNSFQEFSSECSERYLDCNARYLNALVEGEFGEFPHLEQAKYFALGVGLHFRDPKKIIIVAIENNILTLHNLT
jgi:hypothetical protein